MPRAGRLVPTMLRLLTLAAMSAASVQAFAAAPTDTAAARMAHERAGIQAERDRLEAQFAAEQARCAERFAVTACLDDVRERRRSALEGPRARALALDDAERRSRAAARREAVVQKQRRLAELPPPAAAAAPGPAPSAPLPLNDRPVTRARAPAAASSAAAEAAAAQRAAAARQRRLSIQAEQARVEARRAERARQGKVAAPLPVPAASRPASK